MRPNSLQVSCTSSFYSGACACNNAIGVALFFKQRSTCNLCWSHRSNPPCDSISERKKEGRALPALALWRQPSELSSEHCRDLAAPDGCDPNTRAMIQIVARWFHRATIPRFACKGPRKVACSNDMLPDRPLYSTLTQLPTHVDVTDFPSTSH